MEQEKLGPTPRRFGLRSLIIVGIAALVLGLFFGKSFGVRKETAQLSLLGTQKVEVAATPSVMPANPFVDLARKVKPGVVNISTTVVSYDFFFGAQAQEGMGSGFIFDKEGHILTNYHVINGARKLEVNLANKKNYSATVVGADKSHDWRGVAGTYSYPIWFNGDSAWYHLGKKVLPKGESIIYFLEARDTPASVTTPVDVSSRLYFSRNWRMFSRSLRSSSE